MDPQEIAFDFERPHRFVDLEDGTALVAEPILVAEEYRGALRAIPDHRARQVPRRERRLPLGHHRHRTTRNCCANS